MNFATLGLKTSLVQKLAELGFKTPTEIQSLVIPKLLDRTNLIYSSCTGSGKTFGYLLPILNNLDSKKSPFAVILTPNRHLNIQLINVIGQFQVSCSTLPLPHLNRFSGMEILVTTPIQYLEMDFKRINPDYLVFDEADALDVNKILKRTRRATVKVFCGATLSKVKFNAERIMLEAPNENIKEEAIQANSFEEKVEIVREILKNNDRVLIFCNSLKNCENLHAALGMSNVQLCHSLIPEKTRIIHDFKTNGNALICTDLLSRGLDFQNISTVINFDMPSKKTQYIHRIGRTGRTSIGRAIYFESLE